MKKLLTIIGLALLPALFTLGQTNLPPSPQQTFFQSTLDYFTSQNTNLLTFRASDTVDFSTGVENNQNMQDDILTLHGNFYHSAGYGNITNSTIWVGTAGVTFRNATIAGTLVSGQGEVGVSIVKWDTKLTGLIGLGYWSAEKKSVFVEPALELSKALTDNTFALLRIGYPVFTKQAVRNIGSPLLAVEMGFKF